MNDLTNEPDDIKEILLIAKNATEGWVKNLDLEHEKEMKRLQLEEKMIEHESKQERITLYFPAILYTALLALSVTFIFVLPDHQIGLSILYSLLSAGAGWIAGVGYQKHR